MKPKWLGGIKIVKKGYKPNGEAVLPIALYGNKESCTKQADEVRDFVETLWTFGIDARMLPWRLK